MNHSKVHSQGNVPFSWENQPGISKVQTHQECPTDVGTYALKLPPPPCPLESPKVSGHDLQIPLPPCPFQLPPSRSSSRKGLRRQDDPFLAAYKECTKSVKLSKDGKKGGGSRVGKTTGIFSCKNSCGVREDSLVRLSHLSPAPTENIWVQNGRREMADSSRGTRDMDPNEV